MPQSKMDQQPPRLVEKSDSSWRFPRFSRKLSVKRSTSVGATKGTNTSTLKPKSQQAKSPSQDVTTTTQDSNRVFSIPPPVEHESFTSSVTRSLSPQVHIDQHPTKLIDSTASYKLCKSTPILDNDDTTSPRTSLPIFSMTKNTQTASMVSSSSSILSRAIDRRKLNTKELKLQFDTAFTFQQKDCEMVRSGERISKNEFESRQSKFRRAEEAVVNKNINSRTTRKNSTQIRSTPEPVTKSAQTTKSGLLTPPSSIRHGSGDVQDLQTPRASPIARTLSNLQTPPSSPGIATPPLTPSSEPHTEESLLKYAVHSSSSKNSKVYDSMTSTPTIPSTPESASISSLDTTLRPSSFFHRSLSLQSKGEISEPVALHRRSHSLKAKPKEIAILTLLERDQDQPPQINSFTYPRPLSRAGKPTAGPSSRSRFFGIRAFILPGSKITRAIGLPSSESLNYLPPLPNSIENLSLEGAHQLNSPLSPTPSARPSIDEVSITSSRRPGLRSFSRLSSLIKHPSLTPTSPSFSRKSSAYLPEVTNDKSSPSWPENASSEQLNNIPSEPVNALEDDSSDEEFLGDWKQIPGFEGMLNIRRKKGTSRRHSKDSYFGESVFQPERSSPHLSTTRPRSADLPTFTPLCEDVILGKANAARAVVTEKARRNMFGPLKDDQILHVKDIHRSDHIVFQREDGIVRAVAGTMECLFSELCKPLGTFQDDAFADVLIKTSALICNTFQILNALITNFREGNTTIRERVLTVICLWLRTQPEDILENEIASDMLSTFLGEASSFGHFTSASQALRYLDQMKEKMVSYKKSIEGGGFLSFDAQIQYVRNCTTRTPGPTFPVGAQPASDQVAQYMAALNLILFRDASQTRTLCLWWKSQSTEQQESWANGSDVPFDTEFGNTYTDRVNRLLRRGAMLKYWALTEILQVQAAQLRAKIILKFVDLALALRKLGDMHSSLCIIDALASDSIGGLEKSWELMSAEKITQYESLKALLNYSAYIIETKQTVRNVIPFFPFFVRNFASMLLQAAIPTANFSDASKVHVDHSLESCGYTHRLNAPKAGAVPALIDIKKFRLVANEVAKYRNLIRRNYSFSSNLSKNCLALSKLYIPGRLAFARDSVTYPTASTSAEYFTTSNSLASIGDAIEEKILRVWAKKLNVKQDQEQALLQFLQRATLDVQQEAVPSTTN